MVRKLSNRLFFEELMTRVALQTLLKSSVPLAIVLVSLSLLTEAKIRQFGGLLDNC